MGAIELLFNAQGRASRSHFWLVAAIIGGTPFLIGFAGLVASRVFDLQSASLDLDLVKLTVEGSRADFTYSPWLAILLLPTTIRRLHDRDRSGWRLAAFALALFIFHLPVEAADSLVEGNAFAAPPLSSSANLIFGWLHTVAPHAAAAVAAWCFVELACLRGTIGDNRYGADPLPCPGSPGLPPGSWRRPAR